MTLVGSFEAGPSTCWRTSRSILPTAPTALSSSPTVWTWRRCSRACSVVPARRRVTLPAKKDLPRRQVTFVRLGLQDRLAADQDIWHCYGCTECSSQCPSGAKPASIMSALRQFATDRYACPRLLARVVNNPRSFWLVYIAVAAFLAAMIAVTGTFVPGSGPLRYAGMLPDSAVIPVFSLLTVLPLVAIVVGASRAWRAWYDGSLFATRPRLLGRSIRKAVAEILAHRKFSTCKERRLRPWAHRAVLFSFLGLAVISGVIALLLVAGRSTRCRWATPSRC